MANIEDDNLTGLRTVFMIEARFEEELPDSAFKSFYCMRMLSQIIGQHDFHPSFLFKKQQQPKDLLGLIPTSVKHSGQGFLDFPIPQAVDKGVYHGCQNSVANREELVDI